MAKMLAVLRQHLTVGLLGIGVVGLMVIPAQLSAADGCFTAAVGSIQESENFTPWEGRLTQGLPRPINPKGLSSGDVSGMSPDRIDDIGVAWAASLASGRSERYYLAEQIDESMTSDEFYAAGGLLVVTEPHDPGAGDHVAALKEQLGDRVTVVQIGKFDAALTWGDPRANGVRPHFVSWNEGSVNVSVIAERDADAIINLARGMVC